MSVSRRSFFSKVLGTAVAVPCTGRLAAAAERLKGKAWGGSAAIIGLLPGSLSDADLARLRGEWDRQGVGDWPDPISAAVGEIVELRKAMPAHWSMRVQYASGPRETSRHILITTDWPEELADLDAARSLSPYGQSLAAKALLEG